MFANKASFLTPLLWRVEVSEHGEELSANVSRLESETGSWEVETELPAQRSHHCLAVLGGFIFTAGGSSSRDNGGDAACNLLYRYDPRHNQWTRVRSPSRDVRYVLSLQLSNDTVMSSGRSDEPAASGFLFGGSWRVSDGCGGEERHGSTVHGGGVLPC